MNRLRQDDSLAAQKVCLQNMANYICVTQEGGETLACHECGLLAGVCTLLDVSCSGAAAGPTGMTYVVTSKF
mgnify:CR=1 FL=1